MTCPCEDKCAGKLPPKAIEIVKECGPVLFHKVPYPASLGVPTDEELRALQYKNVLLEVEANKHVYLYSSDGVPTLISKGDIDPTEILEAISELQQNLAAETTAREEGDTNLQEQLTGLSNTVDEELNAVHATTTALQNDVAALQGTTVQKDTAISADASTVTVTKTTGELSTEGTETAMPLPVASAEQAGVMNASTFSAVRENSENIDSILGGAITLSTIPADPTQEQLTDAWKTATGKTELVNRASIYDETNKLVWYYYANASEWKSMPAGDAAVSVSIATNDTAGIVKGSTEDGQVAVETDGSMSLNGYDAIKSDIANLSSEIEGVEVPKVPQRVYTPLLTGANSGWMAYYSGNSRPDGIGFIAQGYDTTTGTSALANGFVVPYASSSSAGVMRKSDKSKLDSLLPIQSLGEGLELSDDGVLTVVGGGSGADLPALVFGQPKGVSWFSTSIGPTAMSLKGPMYDTTTSTQLEQEQYWTLTNVSYNGAGLMTSYDKIRFDSLADIKTIGSGLSLSDEGELTANGGGGSATLYSEYGTNTDGALTQAFMSEKLNGDSLVLGNGASTAAPLTTRRTISIGYNASTGAATSQSNPAHISIGSNAQTTGGYDCVAIGQGAKATASASGGGHVVAIGPSAGASGSNSVVIGYHVLGGTVGNATLIGAETRATSSNGTAMGYNARVNHSYSVALGVYSLTGRANEVSIGNTEPTGDAPATRYLANVTAAALDTDATNLAQVRSATVGDVLYAGTDAEATITLTSPVSQYEKVEIIGSWTMPHTDATTPLQVIGHWHLNDQDNSRTFQLRAVDVDPTANQKTEVVETWSFTGSTTLQMISGAQISGELTEQVMEALETPQIIVTKVVGIKAI